MWMTVWRGRLNIPLSEYLSMTPGEFFDAIACYQVIEWGADLKAPEKYVPDLR